MISFAKEKIDGLYIRRKQDSKIYSSETNTNAIIGVASSLGRPGCRPGIVRFPGVRGLRADSGRTGIVTLFTAFILES